MSANPILSTNCPSFLRPVLNRINNSPIGSRLVKGFFWSLTGAAISRGMMLIAWIIIARILGKKEYGELGMIQSTISMLGIFAGFGLGMTATKHVAELRNNNPVRAGRIIRLSEITAAVAGGLMASGLFLFAPWFAANTINAPHLTGSLRIGTAMLFISTLNGAQIGALSGFEAFRTIAYVNLYVGLSSVPILIAGTYLGDLSGVLWALVISLCISLIFSELALYKEANKSKVPLAFRHCTREWSILWKFSVPAFLAGAMVGPANWLCRAILVNKPGGYNEMGIFSAADQWNTMLLFLPGLLGNVILPVLSERLSQQETKESLKTMVIAIKINALSVLPIAIIASIISPTIMSLYGEGFKEGWLTLVIVLLTTGLVAIQTPVGQIIAASGKMWIGFVMNTAWAVIFILGTLLLLDKGAVGLAIARAGSYFFHTIWVFGFAFYILGMAKPTRVQNR